MGNEILFMGPQIVSCLLDNISAFGHVLCLPCVELLLLFTFQNQNTHLAFIDKAGQGWRTRGKSRRSVC